MRFLGSTNMVKRWKNFNCI